MTATALTAGRAVAAGGADGSATGATETVTVTPQQAFESLEHLKTGVTTFTATFTEDTSTEAAQLASQVRRDINLARLAIHLPAGAGINAAQLKVWKDAQGTRAVHLPYAGSVVAPSGLTVAYDAKGTRQATMEQIYQPRTPTSGTVAIWLNGTLQRSVLIDATGIAGTTPAPTTSTPSDHTIASWWSDFTYCLGTIMAVPHWVINGLAIACAFTCLISAGLGCILCLTGAAGAWGFAVSFCIGWASG